MSQRRSDPQRTAARRAILDRARRKVERWELENDELRRLLAKHQWSGVGSDSSTRVCPECLGVPPPRGDGHRPGCAIAAALAEGES